MLPPDEESMTWVHNENHEEKNGEYLGPSFRKRNTRYPKCATSTAVARDMASLVALRVLELCLIGIPNNYPLKHLKTRK